MKLALLKLLCLGFRTSGDDECEHMCLLTAVLPCFLLFGLGLFLFVASWHIGFGCTRFAFVITALAEESGCGWILGTWIA